MTKQWKAGDLAVIEVRDVSNSLVFVYDTSNKSYAIPISQLRLLPPKMTEAEKALVTAALARRKTMRSVYAAMSDFADLIDAVYAERAPPDPLEVAIAVWREWVRAYSLAEESAVRAALKAYDAAKEKKS